VELFLKNLFAGVGVGSVYGLIALGIVIIYKSSKIFNFAVGGLVTIGSYMCWIFMAHLHIYPILAVFGTLIFSIALGFLIERTTLRPIVGQPLLASIMMTLALSSLFDGLILFFSEGRFRAYPLFFSKIGIKVGETSLSFSYLASMVALIILFGVLSAFFKYSRTGLGMRAAAEDHQIARSKGVNIKYVFGLSWAMCSILCSLGGILLGMITGAASFYLGILGLKAFPVVLVAGLESLTGCIIVGPLIGIVEIFSASYISPYLPWKTFEEVAPYLVMLIIILIKPYGFFGLEKIERI